MALCCAVYRGDRLCIQPAGKFAARVPQGTAALDYHVPDEPCEYRLSWRRSLYNRGARGAD